MASVQLLSAVEVLTPTNEEGAVVAIDWSTGLVPFSSKIWLAARTRRGNRVDRLPLLPEALRDKGRGRGGRGASCREDEAKFIRASSTTFSTFCIQIAILSVWESAAMRSLRIAFLTTGSGDVMGVGGVGDAEDIAC